MPFNTFDEVEQRLAAETPPLSDDEVRELLPWVPRLLDTRWHRFQVEVSYREIIAIHNFERRSKRMSLVMTVAAVVQAFLAAVTLCIVLRH
jgi:hypothetical protein